MSVPVWPASLPQYVLLDGFSFGFGEGRLKTAMDAGPGKMRRRFSAVAKPVAAQIIVGANGLAKLDDFWTVDTKGGSLPFKIRNQLYLSLLIDPGGAPLIPNNGPERGLPWLVMFGDPPSVTKIRGGANGQFRIAFGLSVMP